MVYLKRTTCSFGSRLFIEAKCQICYSRNEDPGAIPAKQMAGVMFWGCMVSSWLLLAAAGDASSILATSIIA